MNIVQNQHGDIIELHIDGTVYTPESLRAALRRPIATVSQLTNVLHAASAVIDWWIDIDEPTPLDIHLAALGRVVSDVLQGKTKEVQS